MRHDRATQRSLRRTAGAAARILGEVVAPWRRPARLRWGTRPGEVWDDLPGEDLIPDPVWAYTHAVSIDAPPGDVWPWVVQVGQERGGFYSFERLEDLVGCRITNTDVVVPAWQHPEVGDEVRLHPKAPALHVVAVEPGRSLVLRGTPAGQPAAGTDNLWAFHVLPDGPGRTRLVERGKTVHGDSLADRLFFSPLLVEPIGFVMSREMLLGIKERAEAGAARPGAGAAGVAGAGGAAGVPGTFHPDVPPPTRRRSH